MKIQFNLLNKTIYFTSLILINVICLFSSQSSWAQIKSTSHVGFPITITGLPNPVCGTQVALYTCKGCNERTQNKVQERIQTALKNASLVNRVRVEYDKDYNFTFAMHDIDKDIGFPVVPFYRDKNDVTWEYLDAYVGVDGELNLESTKLIRDPNDTRNEGTDPFNGTINFPKGTKDGYIAILLSEFRIDPLGQFDSYFIIPFVVEGPTVINENVKIIDTIQEPQLPYLVLHAPPGDQSSTEFTTGKTTCRQMSTKVAESKSHSANAEVKIGFAGSAGLFVTTAFEFSVTFSAGFETGDMQYKQTQDQTCITVNEGFKTSSVKGDKGSGDVFIGYGSDLAIGFYPLIYVDEATCSVVSDSGLIFGRIKNSLREFALTKRGIEANITELDKIVADSSNLDPRITNNAQNQIDVWNQVLQMNLDNIDNPDNTPIGPNFELREGVEKFREESISVTQTNTIEYEQYIQAKAGIQAKIEVAGSGVSGGYEFKVGTKYGKTQNQSDATSNLIKYTLKDDDPGDKFNIQIVRDPMFGTPIFRSKDGTRSSCPYQGGYQRDQPKLTFDDGSQNMTLMDMPKGGTGTFQIKLCNDSDEDRTYYLKGNSNTNLDGAIVEGFGNNLFNTNDDGIEFLIPAHDCLNNATLSIKQANTSILNYEDIELYLNVLCQPASASIASNIFLDAHFADDTPVSNLNKDDNGMTVLPNPNNGLFQVRFDNKTIEGQLSVHDLNGKKLFQKELLDGETLVKMNLSKLSPGIYILIAQNELESNSQKLVIKR